MIQAYPLGSRTSKDSGGALAILNSPEETTISFPFLAKPVDYPRITCPGTRVGRIRRHARIIIDIKQGADRPYVVDKAFLGHLRDLTLQDQRYIAGLPILQAVCRAFDQNDDPNPKLGNELIRNMDIMRALMNTAGHDETYRIFDPSFPRPFITRKEEIIWWYRNFALTRKNLQILGWTIASSLTGRIHQNLRRL